MLKSKAHIHALTIQKSAYFRIVNYGCGFVESWANSIQFANLSQQTSGIWQVHKESELLSRPISKIKAHLKAQKFQEPSPNLSSPTNAQVFSFAVVQYCKNYCRTLTLFNEEERNFHMRRTAALWPAASKFRFMHPSEGRWVSTVTPRKSADNDAAEGHVSKTEADPDTIVAFSRPPPVPPFLGPLVALSLLDSWLKRDSNDY